MKSQRTTEEPVADLAGSKELFSEAKPLFDVMGKASFFLGDVGAGAKAKLVVNMIMGARLLRRPISSVMELDGGALEGQHGFIETLISG